jgi:hypothetical protein
MGALLALWVLPWASATSAAEPAHAAEAAPPTYATVLPGPAVLTYELRRGSLTGRGDLVWRNGPQGYELSIDGTVFGLQVLSWASRGAVGRTGLAPARFTDKRLRREANVATFDRARNLITYSGSAEQHALRPGAQDRLSWMLQLAAIAAARSTPLAAGDRVSMQVTGARGGADIWTFAVLGRPSVEVIGGRIEHTVALRREPRKAKDTLVEVWLDPARQHLPVRLKLGSADGDALEFVLKP